MTMKVTPLATYWTTDEAATAIDFLDRLRDALWETYGEQITRWHCEAYDNRTLVTDQLMEPPMFALKAPRQSAISAFQTG